MKDSAGNSAGLRAARFALSSILAALVAATSIAVTWLGGAWLRRSVREMERRRGDTSRRCVARGIVLDRASMRGNAFKYFQLALETAETRKDKIRAGLAIAEFLRDRARRRPHPYGMMATQYLEAVLDLKPERHERFRCHRVLMDVATYTGEMDRAVAACREALLCVPNDDAAAELHLKEMDLFLDHGTWRDMRAALERSVPLESEPKRGYRFAWRRALAGERILRDSEWFDEWSAGLAVEKLKAARSALVSTTVEQFAGLEKCGVERVVNDSMFRAARLLYHDGRYAEAEKSLHAFLRREAGIHQGEAVLIMTGLARIRDNPERASDMMSVFLKRFLWNASAGHEFRQVVLAVIKGGHPREALALIDEYLKLPIRDAERPNLLYEAGMTAVGLEDYVRADRYFREILRLNPGNGMVVKAMLACADVRVRQNDFDGAYEWLVTYLRGFPYEASYGDALFRLFDVQMRRDVGSAEIISLAISAANETPGDERAAKALMAVAEELEAVGLPALAQEQYNKVALLQYVGTDRQTALRQAGSGATLARALLGHARCLYTLGRTVNADRLLRELCNSLEPGPLRSEAALLWAGVAVSNEQDMEARRRLRLIDAGNASPEVLAGAAFRRLLLDADVNTKVTDSIAGLAKLAERMSPDKRLDMLTEAYATLFRRLARRQSAAEMRALFEVAATGVEANGLPLQEFSLQLGKAVLAKEGLKSFVECIEANNELIEKAGQNIPDDVEMLLGAAKSIHEQRVAMDRHL